MKLDGFRGVLAREARRIWGNRHLRMICLVSPFLYGLLLSGIYYDRRITNEPFALVDMDNSALSRRAARWIDATENINIVRRCRSAAEAQAALASGALQGYVYIPKDFSRAIKRGGDARLRAAVNYGNIAVGNQALLALSDVAAALSAGVSRAQTERYGLARERADNLNQLVRADVRTIFNPQMNYSDFFIPGLIFVVLQQIIIVGLSFSMAEERESGSSGALFEISGRSFGAIIAGKAVLYITLNYAISLVFIFVLLPVFGLGAAHGAAGLLLFTFIFVACTSAFGLFVSSLFRDTVSAFLALMFFSMPAFLISGFSWPSYAMPFLVRALALPIPSTHFMPAFRAALGAPVPGAPLLRPALIMAALTLLYLAAARLALKRAYRPRRGGEVVK